MNSPFADASPCCPTVSQHLTVPNGVGGPSIDPKLGRFVADVDGLLMRSVTVVAVAGAYRSCVSLAALAGAAEVAP